ncbi:MAG: HlyC/CorC family transporter [Deltaproteobacteria bacterium]|nr:HlyC/CorC family transporter [Deltaproteobacteria bacterium]
MFVALNGFFVLCEFALVKSRATRLQEMAENGSVKARKVLDILHHLDSYISATQIGITLASLALGWVGEPAFARLLKPAVSWTGAGSVYVQHVIATVLAFASITFLHTVVGEIVPKAIGIQKAESVAMSCASALALFHAIFRPLVYVLNGAANLFVRLLGFKPGTEGDESHSEEELRMIVASSHRHGVLDASTRDLLDNVLDYTERVAREVMTPRRDVVTLDASKSLAENLDKALTGEYTRYPLVDPTQMERVLGFVHLKDLFAVEHGRRKANGIRELARNPVYVPETLPIDRLRRQLQGRHTHFAVVVDEFGEWTGIVTLEDLLEELVGEIQDELDTEEPKYVRRADGTVDVDGSVLLEHAMKKLALEPPDEDPGVTTLGGYVFSILGRQPAVKDHVVLSGRRVEILDVEGLRVRRVRVHPATPLAADGEEEVGIALVQTGGAARTTTPPGETPESLPEPMAENVSGPVQR